MKSLNQAAIAVAVATLATIAGAQETHIVVAYLNHLDQDAAAREAHAKDPVGSMAKFGFDDAQQQVVLSGDKAAIAKLAGVEDKKMPAPQVPNAAFE